MSEKDRKAYLSSLRELLPMVRSACGHIQHRTSDELDTERNGWAKVLFGKIPLSRLNEITFAAIQDKVEKSIASNKPFVFFGANDVLAHWLRLNEKKELSDHVKKLKRNDCVCDNGFVTYYDPIQKQDKKIRCRFHPG